MVQLYNFRPQTNVPSSIPQDVPVYRVNHMKFYADDELMDEGTIYVWPDEPNLALEPLNDLAMEKMIAFLTKLDVCGKEKSQKDGKAYISYLAAFKAKYAEPEDVVDNRRGRKLTDKREMASFGPKKNKVKRGGKLDLSSAEDFRVNLPSEDREG